MTIVIRNRMIQKNPNPRITYTIGGQINWQSQPIPWLLYLIEETPINKYIKRCLIVCSERERERERERGGPGVLEFGGGFLLDAEDDGVGATDTDGGVALADGFEGVFDLEQMAIWWENCYCSIVPCHSSSSSTQLNWSPLSLCLFLKTILKLSLTHCVFLIANLNLSHKATHPLKSCCVMFLTGDPEKLDRIR